MADSIDPSPVSDVLERLTAREREVLLLVLQDLSTKEIAAQLDIDASRVSSHKSSVMRKLGIATEFRLILFGIRMGIVKDE